MKMHVFILILLSTSTANLVAMDQSEEQAEEQVAIDQDDNKEEKKELIHKPEEEKEAPEEEKEQKIEVSDHEPKSRSIPWSKTKKTLRRSRSTPNLNILYDPIASSSVPFPILLSTLNSLAILEDKKDAKEKSQEKGDFFNPRQRAHNVLMHQQKNEKRIHFLKWYKKRCEELDQCLEVKKQKTIKAIQHLEGDLKTLEKEYLQAAITYQSSAAEAGKRSVYGQEQGIGSYVPSLASMATSLVSVAPSLGQGVTLLKGYFYAGS